MKNILYKFALCCFVMGLIACSDDDESLQEDVVVAFANPSQNFSNEDQIDIKLVFSAPTPSAGEVVIRYELNNLSETNFSTSPSFTDSRLSLPIPAGVQEVSFSVNRENFTAANEAQFITFSITDFSLSNGFIQGYTETRLNFTDQAVLGGTGAPEVGGPNQGNQVYVDLSTQTTTKVRRDAWDLAFYNADDFRVKLNASLYMMAAELPTTDFAEVNSTSVNALQQEMAFLVEGSNQYVDDPSGDITQTAIDEISLTASENKIYLLKLGNEVGTETPETGSVAVAGGSRGWLKIRILRENGAYVLQYASLDDPNYEEINISKTQGHHFNFFSFSDGPNIAVEPEKNQWDLCFTVMTEVLDLPEGGMGAYGFSDYVATNTLANVKAYEIDVEQENNTYADFDAAQVEESRFEIDQRVIGADWRDVFSGQINNSFYVIEDANGNRYKLRFTAMLNENGVRGYPKFEYQLLKNE